jgi:hypothetical protein
MLAHLRLRRWVEVARLSCEFEIRGEMDELTVEASARLAASTLIVHDGSVDFESWVFLFGAVSACNGLRVKDKVVKDCTTRGGTYQERNVR